VLGFFRVDRAAQVGCVRVVHVERVSLSETRRMFLGFDIIQDRRWPQSGERGCFCSNGGCGECGEYGECGAVSAVGAISAQPTKTV
jgi:hypothetical protein